MSGKTIHVALTGNPNAGKSSIFNNLTGANQHVANYPGVTVETKEGICQHEGKRFRIVDLPGTYSLTANSPEEQIARQFLLEEKPDVVVQVIDASNLERSLYLTLQLLELGVKLILDLNMMDEARARGMRIDSRNLGERLGVSVVETVASRNQGSEELLAAIKAATGQPARTFHCRYGEELGRLIEQTATRLEAANGSASRFPPRWAAVKLFEGDQEILDWLSRDVQGGREIQAELAREVRRLSEKTGESTEALVAESRYGALAGIFNEAVTHEISPHLRQQISERIDAVILNRILGFPIFLLIMFMMFQFVFSIGEYPMNWIEGGFGWLGSMINVHMAAGPLRSLLVDGIIGGVGGVIVFVPNILLLFFAIGLLENSGYMARAAFIMDRIMHKIGLHGRSFIPLITGFGCSVPAIMATRTLEHEKDRLATMMVVPLMSCSARLPIYSLLIPAFFSLRWRGTMFFLIYVIGITLAVVLVKILRVTILAGESTPFVMELPPYRMPTLRSTLTDMLQKATLYLRKAGTTILALSIILWAATSYPKKASFEVDRTPRAAQAIQMSEAQKVGARKAENLAYSLAGRTGRAMQVVFKPLGFDWKVCTALIGALAAKEVFVAQLGIVHSMGETSDTSLMDLRATLAAHYKPLTGFCIMLFCLITSPCMATVATMRRESNSWKWPLLQFFGLTALAWILTFAVYQIGTLLKIGA